MKTVHVAFVEQNPDGHTLSPANGTSLFLCECGKAYFGCANIHEAESKHAMHLEAVREVHQQIRDEQAAGNPWL